MKPTDEEAIIVDKETLKILAVDTRIDILKELKTGSKTLSDLSRILKKDKSTILEHLIILTKAGLVRRVQNPGKKFVFYSLTEKGSNIFIQNQKTKSFEARGSQILLVLIAIIGVLLVGGPGIYYYYTVLSPQINSQFQFPQEKEARIFYDPTLKITHFIVTLLSFSILPVAVIIIIDAYHQLKRGDTSGVIKLFFGSIVLTLDCFAILLILFSPFDILPLTRVCVWI